MEMKVAGTVRSIRGPALTKTIPERGRIDFVEGIEARVQFR